MLCNEYIFFYLARASMLPGTLLVHSAGLALRARLDFMSQ